MKAKIKEVKFSKEFESKFGKLYVFIVKYEDKTAFYTSKNKNQKNFIQGEEVEFTEEVKEKNGKKYLTIKPLNNFQRKSNFGKALNREQSKYSGFAMAYAKDLVVAEKIKLQDLSYYTKKMFSLMVELDKTLEK